MRTFWLFPALLFCTAVVACARSDRGPTISVTSEETIVSSGITRTYRLHVPPSYRSGRDTPLVIGFHGAGWSSAEQELLSGMSLKADQAGFIAVYPDAHGGYWSMSPGADGQVDRQFVLDLIQSLRDRYSIDAKRIYATGFSNGGGMANRLGCDMADVFAAIAPVSGAYNLWKECDPSRPMPVLAFHGMADKVVPYQGVGVQEPPIHEWASAWAERNGCQPTPFISDQSQDVTVETWEGCNAGSTVTLYTIEEHAHGWPGSDLRPGATSQAIDATDVMWDFFMSHPMP